MRKLLALLLFFTLAYTGLLARVPTNIFAAQGGNDTTGTGLIGAPYQTIAKALSVAACGDTINLRGSGVSQGDGTFTEQVLIKYGSAYPLCSSWGNAVTIKNYNGETVLWKCTTIVDTCAGFGDFSHGAQYNIFYIVTSDTANTFTISGSPNQGPGPGAVCKQVVGLGAYGDHVRLQNLNITGANTSGIAGGGNGDDAMSDLQLLSLHVYSNGTARGGDPDIGCNGAAAQDHNVYWDGKNGLIQGGEYDHSSYSGIQQFDSSKCLTDGDASCRDDNTITGVYAHDNLYGITVAVGHRNNVLNSIVVDNTVDGIASDFRCRGCQFRNNTVTRNTGHGITIGSSSGGGISNVVTCNIAYSNTAGNINDLGTGTTLADNFTSNPTFVNGAGNDFHLQSGSGARGYCANYTSVGNTYLALDFFGFTRPPVAMWDAGFSQYANYSASAGAGSLLLHGR